MGISYKVILSVLLIGVSVIVAQSQEIDIRTEYNDNTQMYEIVSNNRSNSSKVVKVSFTTLKNLKCRQGNNGFTATAYPGRQVLTTLKRIQDDRATNIDYKLKIIDGIARPKVIHDFAYCLPIKSGNSTDIREMSYLGKEFGDREEPLNWYSITLSTTIGDTIYAARKGKVSRITSENNSSAQSLLFAKGKNSISIEQMDGTIAYYALFKDNGFLVEEGQMVFPGQPIGIIGGENYDSGSHLRFSIRYFYEYKGKNNQNFFAYVKPLFVHKEGTSQLDNNTNH